MKYHIVTFGCQQNVADSERIAGYYKARGYHHTNDINQADDIIVNTCMIRQTAEDRVYGLVHNIALEKNKGRKVKLIITGCMTGMAMRDTSGKLLSTLRKKLPAVDEFLPIEEVGFDSEPVRTGLGHVWVPITNGCNNFCTYCVVPLTRGREISRAFDEIIAECRNLIAEKQTHITLLGQNVNSYGADLISGKQIIRDIDSSKDYFGQEREIQRYTINGRDVKPTYVKHLGRLRIPTLFPQLLRAVAELEGVETVDFMSSNPWDFSDDLITVIADHKTISRAIHLPVQSGDNEMLKMMNRWYTREEYIELVSKLRKAVPDIVLSTDIIVGFCGETITQFENTVDLCRTIGFSKAYISMYSDRPLTSAHNNLHDTIPHGEKRRRWRTLENLINKPNIKHVYVCK